MKKRLSMIPRADPKTPGKTGPTGALAGARTPGRPLHMRRGSSFTRLDESQPASAAAGHSSGGSGGTSSHASAQHSRSHSTETADLVPGPTTVPPSGSFTTGVEKLVDVREPARLQPSKLTADRKGFLPVDNVGAGSTEPLYTPHVKRVLEDIAEVHRARHRRTVSGASSSSDRADGDAGGGRVAAGGVGTGARARAQRV